ncbi:helix-turn-helix domain-containing protein [Salmonella enterica]|nr:helix-turn-helix domain-containing protein [Salmonella enterica]
MNNLNIFNMKIELTVGQKAELKFLHRAYRDKRICDRIKAILLASEVWNVSMIAQAFRLHEGSVNRHIREYLNNGN